MGQHPLSDLFIVVGKRGLGQADIRIQDPVRIGEPSRSRHRLPPGLGRLIILAIFGEMLGMLPTDRRAGLSVLRP